MPQERSDKPKKTAKRPVGRPPLQYPDPIEDTPENVARIVVNTPHKHKGEWGFENENERECCGNETSSSS